MAYVGMWRPLKTGHSWDSVERILSQLRTLMDNGVHVGGEPNSATIDDWMAALDELIIERRPKLQLPLTSHKYLVDMVAAAARARAAKDEALRASRARGETPTGYSSAHTPANPPPSVTSIHELVADIRALERMIEHIGDTDARKQLESDLQAKQATLATLRGAKSCHYPTATQQ